VLAIRARERTYNTGDGGIYGVGSLSLVTRFESKFGAHAGVQHAVVGYMALQCPPDASRLQNTSVVGAGVV